MDRAKIVACLIALLGVSCSRPPRIVVASKNFTEQVLLGEILARHIERRLGVTVERKLNLGGTMLAHEALIKGVADTMVSSGMKAVGYEYVNLDDCWMNGRDGLTPCSS